MAPFLSRQASNRVPEEAKAEGERVESSIADLWAAPRNLPALSGLNYAYTPVTGQRGHPMHHALRALAGIIRNLKEVFLVDHVQYRASRPLHDLVFQGGNGGRCPPSGFGM
jgi:hypothetical protein